MLALEIVIIKALASFIFGKKLFNSFGGKIVNYVDKIDFNSKEHFAVMGRSRHGKTYATVVSCSKIELPVIFFNTQHETDGLGKYAKFNPSENTFEQLQALIKAKRKINYIPSTKPKMRDKQLEKLIDLLYERFPSDRIKCIWDETHLFKKGATGEQLTRLATTGLRWGKECIFLTQRPAMMENNLLSQSTRKIIFQLDDVDYSYLKNLGWSNELIGRIASMTNDYYLFVDYDGRDLKGAFKIK